MLCLAIGLGASAAQAARPVTASVATQPVTYTDQLIVKLRDPIADALPSSDPKFHKAQSDKAARVSARLEARGKVKTNYLRTLKRGAQVFKLPGHKSIDEIKGLMRHLENDPDFEYAEPDLIAQPTVIPNDTYYAYQWHYFEPVGGINLPYAWDRSVGLPDVTVAVIDTGIRPNHPDLVGRVLPGYDFIHDPLTAGDGNGYDPDATDPGDFVTAAQSVALSCPFSYSSWHGTHVAGTIAAATNNGVGVAGVATNAKILPVRVLGKCGGYTSDIADGIWWAAGYASNNAPTNLNPARVINMSLGGAGQCSMTEQAAIDAAVAAGVVVVVAAGNEGVNAAGVSPASCNNVITVAANGRNGDLASYSNYGTTTVKISAPGNSVLSTVNTGTTTPLTESYGSMSGTSMAAPHVAGVAALILGASPLFTPAEVLTQIQSTARPFALATTCHLYGDCGAGIIDANAALQALIADDTTPNGFAFVDQTNVALNTLISSSTITVSGINTATPISITGCTSAQCEYNINNSVTWIAMGNSLTVRNGNTVKVRQKSSTSQSAPTSLMLSIGGVTGSFGVTTGAPGTLQFSAPTYTVAESGITATLTVSRIGGSMGAASVGYATANGTATGSATAGLGDYTTRTGTLSWLAGDTAAKTIAVTITNDTTVESDETFTVSLGNAVGAGLGAQSVATVTITDNDSNIQFDAATASVNESAGTVTLNVTRTGTLGAAASTRYATAAGTALATGDFTITSGTLNWGAGDGSTKTITVPIVNNTLVEGLETFSVMLNTPTGATLGGTNKSTVTIVDNDSAIQFAAATATVNEAAGTLTLNVTRTAGAGASLDVATVAYATANGTAIAGSDYTATSGTLTWGAGDIAAKTITVPISNDTLVESGETFAVTLSNPVGAILGTAKTATIIITDNDSNLQFGATVYSVTETGPVAILSVTRTGTLTAPASVQYATADGTATAGSDYTASSGTLNWVAGNGAAKIFTVPITNDTLVEGAETFTASLSNPAGATLGATTAAGVTINDNDSLLQFSAASYVVSEIAGSVVVSVNRIGNPSQAVTVNYATANGTATAGGDYTARTGTLSWLANNTAPKTIVIPVTNDLINEGPESFTVTLSNGVNASLGGTVNGTITIVDNEAAPVGGITFSQAKYTVAENGGSAAVTVTRSGDTSAPATVNYATTAGSAIATDFTATSGILFWTAGDATPRTINIPVFNDLVVEQVEAFTVTLSNAVGSTLGAPVQAMVSITDNDDAFPRGGIMPTGWSKPVAANGGWHASAEQFQAGIYSLASDGIGDGEVAQVEIDANFVGGAASFALKTASEPGFDYLRFYIDGVKMGEWSGVQTVWTTVSYPLTAGVHRLAWSYEKDGSGTNGIDAAWIDTVSLPAIAP